MTIGELISMLEDYDEGWEVEVVTPQGNTMWINDVDSVGEDDEEDNPERAVIYLTENRGF
jgi:hypothetical protein